MHGIADIFALFGLYLAPFIAALALWLLVAIPIALVRTFLDACQRTKAQWDAPRASLVFSPKDSQDGEKLVNRRMNVPTLRSIAEEGTTATDPLRVGKKLP